jgi:hypothetical protein
VKVDKPNELDTKWLIELSMGVVRKREMSLMSIIDSRSGHKIKLVPADSQEHEDAVSIFEMPLDFSFLRCSRSLLYSGYYNHKEKYV